MDGGTKGKMREKDAVWFSFWQLVTQELSGR
jgi:hypothetical protein